MLIPPTSVRCFKTHTTRLNARKKQVSGGLALYCRHLEPGSPDSLVRSPSPPRALIRTTRAASTPWPAYAGTKDHPLQDLARGEEIIGKVLLATYHAAKGREFDTVILPGPP
jgi:hypothetical protein